ncbi:MAG: Gfo/Idh/MocA family oxidoreductase, partial [Clostridium sp.]|nr:Gfo/Idh/MocA family oxidoreductase [Clostridium sp.]
EAYKRVYGVEPEIVSLASTSAGAKEFAETYHIPRVYRSLEELLHTELPDVVDICTPPSAHFQQVCQVLKAGCHVICEKPLSGWFEAGDSEMLSGVTEQMDELRRVLECSQGKFFYAENFIYAPAVQKSAELIRAARDKILFLKGEESHSGSHAAHAALWSKNGGGSLIRQGCHPLTALLYLKRAEDVKAAKVVSVVADMGYLLPRLKESEKTHINARPADVEDLANVILTFADGTKAYVMAGDMVLGGVRNQIEVYTTGGVHQCNIAPSTQMQVYHVEDEKLASVYFTEKVETKKGWQPIFLEEDFARGYVGEMRDFLLCAAGEKDAPECGFELAYETIRIIYAAYLSAQKGCRVDL